MASDTIVWIHGDNLNPHNPALTAHAGAPALFVFDDHLLQEWRLSLKRIIFLYECLLELPVVIRRGDVATEVTRFARQHAAGRVAAAGSPSPRFQEIVAALRESGLPVEIYEPPPFLDLPDDALDLKRFSRYWKTARKSL